MIITPQGDKHHQAKNMQMIFDYIYFRTFRIYQNRWKEKIPMLYALSLVTILQVFLVSIIIFAYALVFQKYSINPKISLILFVLFLTYNYLRYKSRNNNYEKLSGKWRNESKINTQRKGWLIFIFIVVTFSIFLTLAILIGEINRNIV